MTSPSPAYFRHRELALVGDSPTGIRSASLLAGIDGLLRHCGLTPLRYRPVRQHEAALEARAVAGLEQALAAVGAEGIAHVADSGPAHLTPDALAAAVADPEVVELRTGGAGWALTLPLRAGAVMAVSRCPELSAARLPDLLGGLLEACQADWAVADAPPILAARLAGHALTPGAVEVAAPPLGAFNWRCADWLTDVDWRQATLPAGVHCARAASGASVVELDPATPAAITALIAALPGLGQTWSRPPLLRWLPDAGPALTVRPASPPLAARQRFLADQVSARFGVTPDNPSLHAALASHWAGSPATPIWEEAIAAFVGEAALCHGGRWHRVLDPAQVFPETLIVVVEGRGAFNPHAALRRWRHGGTTPFAALAAFLGPTPGPGSDTGK